MLKYKNISRVVQRFRAHDTKMKKRVFEVKPGEMEEFGRELSHPYMEEVKSGGKK